MTIKVNIHYAKTNMSKLLLHVKEGREVIIANSGKPVARLVPYTEPDTNRLPGSANGLVSFTGDIHESLSEEELENFEI